MSFKMDVEEYLAGTEQVLCHLPAIFCRLCRPKRTKEALISAGKLFSVFDEDNKLKLHFAQPGSTNMNLKLGPGWCT